MKTTKKKFSVKRRSLITGFDLTDWDGDEGDFIRVRTRFGRRIRRVTITIRNVLGVPFEFKTAPWALTSGLGQWRNN